MITQANSSITIHTPLGADAFVLTHLTGHEGLSESFAFTLSVFSEQTQIAPADLLGKSVTVSIQNEADQPRVINGIVKTFVVGSIDLHQYRHYQLEIMPWFDALKYTSDCRVFDQNQTIPEIFSSVCKELGFTAFDMRGLTKTYPKKPYCVQYNETYFDFLSRLLQEAGIFYYYQHTQQTHTLVLCDQVSTLPKMSSAVQYRNADQTRQHLSLWEQSLVYQEPSAWKSQLIYAAGNYPEMMPGLRFALTDHEDESAQGNYLIVRVEHTAQEDAVKIRFTCIPINVTYVPIKTILKPVMSGVQSAVVVGPTGQEVYTDALGRIKVQFHWDRRGKSNENSSCFLNVLTPWAGNQWGCQFIPRVGDEVLVGFMNGDVDQPVVVGSVYNASNTEMFALPQKAAQSGFKSTLKGGAPGHEVSFDDTPNAQTVTLKSAGNFTTQIKNTLTRIVNGVETATHSQSMSIGITNGNTVIQAKTIQFKVGANQLTFSDAGIVANTAAVFVQAKGVGGGLPHCASRG